MQTFFRDVRYATRGLRKSPAFSVTVVMTLALGVGATAAIFSCVYALLLQSLPFADAGRIVTLSETHPQIAGGIEATFPDYEDWKTQQHSFTQIAAYSTLNPETVSLVTDGRAPAGAPRACLRKLLLAAGGHSRDIAAMIPAICAASANPNEALRAE